MSHRQRKLARLLSTVLMIGIASILCGCDSQPRKFDSIDGSLIFLQASQSVYTPSTGEIRKIVWRSPGVQPRIICTAENDTLIIGTGVNSPILESELTEVGERRFYYKYVPPGPYVEAITGVRDLDLDIYNLANSLDFDRDRRQYLFCGKIQGERKLAVLGLDFEVLSDLTPFLRTDSTGRVILGRFFWAKDGIVCSRNPVSYYYSWNDLEGGRHTRLIPGKILTVSNDGNTMIYEAGYGGSDDIYMYDLSHNAHHRLDLGDELRGFCFSPDDRYIAYAKFTNNFSSDSDLYFYDLLKGGRISTGFHWAYGVFAWINKTPPPEGQQLED